MSDKPDQSNLPAQIAQAIAGVPLALVPSCVKALDRLVGAAVDIPAAWLAQKKAQIDAQTQAYTLVEAAIADAAATAAGVDEATVRNAVSVLVRKSYRKQINREAVASAMVEELRSEPLGADTAATPPLLEEDWLNVFERYAEDASTERMQSLWGRVLSGEIRKPGLYSIRALRFLSEFSREDGLAFEKFGKSAFGDWAPATLVKPGNEDIRDMISLESSGLIQGASGIGLNMTITFNESGYASIREGSLILLLKGEPGKEHKSGCCALTPIGQELIGLLPGRDPCASARALANAIKSPAIKSAALFAPLGKAPPPAGTISLNGKLMIPVEVFWQEEANAAPTS